MRYSLPFLAVAFLAFLSSVNALGDPTGDACRYYSSFYDFGCVTFSYACLCNHTAFIESVVKCIYDYVPEDEQWISWQKTREYCGIPIDLEAIQQTVQSPDFKMLNATTVYFPEKPYTEPIYMPPDKIIPYSEFMVADSSNYRSDRYFACVPIIYMFAVLLLRSLVHFCEKIAPRSAARSNSFIVRKFRKYVTVPSLGRYHHLKPKKLATLFPSYVIPTRAVSLIVFGYVALNFILLFVSIKVAPPNPLMPDVGGERGYAYGRRSGWMCFGQMVLLALFAGRNNFWTWLTGWSMDTFNVFHKWAGIMAVIEVFIHSVGYTVSDVRAGDYNTRLEGAWFRWGIVGTIFFCFIPPFSLRYFRSFNYELFLFMHILFAILVIVASWWHLSIDLPGYEYLYAMIALWAFDRAARLGRSAISGINAKATIEVFPGIGHDGSDDLMRIEISYSRLWKWYPGSYAYVHFLLPYGFWQSHPFTLIPSPNGNLVMYCRVRRGMTRLMAERALIALNSKSKYEVRVLLDGPYGSVAPLKHYSTVVLVAGGSGVTFTIAHALALASGAPDVQRVVFIWSTHNESYLSKFDRELSRISKDPRFEFRYYFTRSDGTGALAGKTQVSVLDPTSDILSESKTDARVHDSPDSEKSSASLTRDPEATIAYGRPNLPQILTDEIRNTQGPLAIAVCGPGSMNDDARAVVVQNIDTSAYRVDYFEESFTW